MNDNGIELMVESVLEDARLKAVEIVEQAEKEAEKKSKSVKRQIRALEMESGRELKKRVEQLERNGTGHLQRELGRIELNRQNDRYSSVMRDIRSALERQTDDPGYPERLCDWIVEGIVGIGSDNVIVNCSGKERPLLTGGILAEAAERVERITSVAPRIAVSDGRTLDDYGIIVTDASGKTAYNNQLPVRAKRFGSEIRQMIHAHFNAIASNGGEGQS